MRAALAFVGIILVAGLVSASEITFDFEPVDVITFDIEPISISSNVSLSIIPDSGILSLLTVMSWDTTAKNFTITLSNTSSNFTLTICNQTINTFQNITRNGSSWLLVRSNATGCNEVYYSLGNATGLTITSTSVGNQIYNPSLAVAAAAIGAGITAGLLLYYRRKRNQ